MAKISDQKRISGCSYRHRVTREKEDMSFIVSVFSILQIKIKFANRYLTHKQCMEMKISDQKRISGCSYRHRVTREKEDMSFIVSVFPLAEVLTTLFCICFLLHLRRRRSVHEFLQAVRSGDSRLFHYLPHSIQLWKMHAASVRRSQPPASHSKQLPNWNGTDILGIGSSVWVWNPETEN